MATITPNYTRTSNYNEQAGIEYVRFAATSAVLEVELNEVQIAANDKLRNIIKLLCGDGVSSLAGISYANNTFTIGGCYALLQGILLYISSLSLAVSSGDYIYLDTWTEMVNSTGVLYQYGNMQGSTVPNYIIESSIGVETSARQVRRYTLSKTTGTAGHTYLLLGRISSGSLITSVELIKSNFQAVQIKKEDTFVSTAGQTVFTLTSGYYTTGKGQLDIYFNGIRQPRSSFTETSSTSFTLKATNITAGIEVVAVYG